MQGEQLTLTEMLELVVVEHRVWKKLDKETQSAVITLCAELIGRAVYNDNNNNKRNNHE